MSGDWGLTIEDAMTIAPNPYEGDLDGRDPVVASRETPAAYSALVGSWAPAKFDRPYAAGKWTAAQVLTHLAQAELMIQPRIRLALTVPDFVVQPFEQDDLLALEACGRTVALAATRSAAVQLP